jgi:hypothetical protein
MLGSLMTVCSSAILKEKFIKDFSHSLWRLRVRFLRQLHAKLWRG